MTSLLFRAFLEGLKEDGDFLELQMGRRLKQTGAFKLSYSNKVRISLGKLLRAVVERGTWRKLP